ncbi:MAG: hypothetical protein LVR00_07185 [Rhabdochlamydiaceae bacterium]
MTLIGLAIWYNCPAMAATATAPVPQAKVSPSTPLHKFCNEEIDRVLGKRS